MARAQYLYYAQRDFAAALAVMHRVQRGLPNDARVWFVSAAIERRLGLWDAAVANFERARDLDPGNSQFRYELVLTPLMQHRYEPALQRVDAELALGGKLTELLEMKLFAEWSLGGLEAGEGMLAGLQVRSQAAHPAAVLPPTPDINALRAAQTLFRRDFKQASELFGQAAAATDDVRSQFFAGAYVPGNVGYRLRQALSEQRGGSPATAAQIYRDVQARAAAALGAKPANPNVEAAWHAVLGLADAGLGERNEAVAEAQRAVGLIPESKDAFEGPCWQDYLAQVYALNGDATRALPLIEHLLQTAGSMTTPALLKLDPVWDPIRGNPAFEALLKSHSADGTDTKR
jgi:serine/threonine-protein kinase